MKNLCILGSTGSIGLNTLEIVRNHSDLYNVAALAVGSNIAELEKQIREFRPVMAAVGDARAAADLSNRVDDLPVRIFKGTDGIVDMVEACVEVDVVVSAIVGSAGMLPTIKALECDKRVALANKETLVAAGELVMNIVRKQQKGNIIPVDSEHSAVFQCIQGEKLNTVEKIILTASGGPFSLKSEVNLEDVTPEQALEHPNWDMGSKITIDSATLINKGLEIIEACRLFDMPPDRIEAVIHPQSIIHSMAAFHDGSVIAQMGLPDMKLPILYALAYPERIKTGFKRMDLFEISKLEFFPVDRKRFPGLDLCISAAETGGTAPAALNAADEIAVASFLNREIRFMDIPVVIEHVLDNIRHYPLESPEQVLDIDREARRKAGEIIKSLKIDT